MAILEDFNDLEPSAGIGVRSREYLGPKVLTQMRTAPLDTAFGGGGDLFFAARMMLMVVLIRARRISAKGIRSSRYDGASYPSRNIAIDEDFDQITSMRLV
jgi:hypothetical protein